MRHAPCLHSGEIEASDSPPSPTPEPPDDHWREPDDSLALRCPHGENTWEYRFNRDQLTELRSLRDGRIVRAIAITSQDGSPATLTVTNHAMRYTAHLDVIRVTAKPGGLR